MKISKLARLGGGMAAAGGTAIVLTILLAVRCAVKKLGGGPGAMRGSNLPGCPIVLLTLVYSVFRLVLDALIDRRRSDASLRLELLVLRHQLRVLERQVKRRQRGRSQVSADACPARPGSASSSAPRPCRAGIAVSSAHGALLAAKGGGTGLWQPNQPSSGELALAGRPTATGGSLSWCRPTARRSAATWKLPSASAWGAPVGTSCCRTSCCRTSCWGDSRTAPDGEAAPSVRRAWQQLDGERKFLEERLKAGLRLTKLHSLLARRRVLMPYQTLHPFCVAELEFAGQLRKTVPVADGEPGKELVCGVPHSTSYAAPGNMRRQARADSD